MASLNLVPNPTVMAVQAGLFLTNIIIIKKLILEPYLTVRKRRIEMTMGSQESARATLQKCEQLGSKIEDEIKNASRQLRQKRDVLRNDALKKREEILRAADVDMRKVLDDIEKEIESALAEERQKVEKTVVGLSESIYGAAIN